MNPVSIPQIPVDEEPVEGGHCVDEHNRLSGVIDWGDIHFGHPAGVGDAGLNGAARIALRYIEGT